MKLITASFFIDIDGLNIFVIYLWNEFITITIWQAVKLNVGSWMKIKQYKSKLKRLFISKRNDFWRSAKTYRTYGSEKTEKKKSSEKTKILLLNLIAWHMTWRNFYKYLYVEDGLCSKMTSLLMSTLRGSLLKRTLIFVQWTAKKLKHMWPVAFRTTSQAKS